MIAVRVDASAQIGTGHLIRCLTLADALKAAGASTLFLCRHIMPQLAALVTGKGHALARLPAAPLAQEANPLPHAAWLGTTQDTDAMATLAALPQKLSLVVLDHYALDYRWQTRLRPVAPLLVIDDLADRRLDCDLLLDQNLNPKGDDRYDLLVPANCSKLLGPNYALLRPQFAMLRSHAERDRTAPVKRILVFFGGADITNLTLTAMRMLAAEGAGKVFLVDVVIGPINPHRALLETWNREQGEPVILHTTNVDMPGLMARADLAIGAGGSTTWERCCLGLPTIVVAAADNQREAMSAVEKSGAIMIAVDGTTLNLAWRQLVSSPAKRQAMSRAATAMVDGLGALRVVEAVREMVPAMAQGLRSG